MACVEIFCAREVRFACIWTEARGCLDSRLRQGNALGGMIVTTKVNAIMHLGELIIRLEKEWIARHSLIQQVSRLEQVSPSYVISECRRQDKISSTRIEIVGDQVLSWSLLYGQCLASGNFGSKLICNCLRQLRFDREHLI